MRFLRNTFLWFVILVLTALAITAITHEGRMAVKTALLLPEVLPDAPIRPLSAITATPVREEVEYPYPGGSNLGTMVRPAGGGRYGAVILLLGINPDLEDEAFWRLTNALARDGVLVLIPRPIYLTEGVLSYEEVQSLVGAFQYLQDHPNVDPKRIGFAGFCVGSSLALVAAGDPRIAGDVRFVNDFGGYFSPQTLVSALTTETMEVDGLLRGWQPNPDARAFFIRAMLNSSLPESERLVLERGYLDGAILRADQLLHMSAEGQAIYRVLTNRDPGQVLELFDDLPEVVKRGMLLVSPENAVPWLQARVLIMHDRNDSYVPFSESRRLLAALEEHPRKHYTEFDLFRHMHPTAGTGSAGYFRELSKLFYHLYLVLLEVA